jgi:hypothetical protein
MKWLKRIRILVIVAPAMFLALAGCAGKPVNKTLQAEEVLVAAGFQLKMADTPAKLERISQIPQKQVMWAMLKGREAYIWADAAGCQCYYQGTRQNYEQLLVNRQEDQGEQRTNWYEAQHNDPLWLSIGWDD